MKLAIVFPIGLNELFRFYRYEPGQQFRKHRDQSYIRNSKEASYFTFMIYLNDDFKGGTTTFNDITIQPKQGSMPLSEWLADNQFKQEECGLVHIDHMRDIYALFHQSQSDKRFNGIYSTEIADEVSLSSVPEGLTPNAIMHFNKDGYSVYCKEYRQYWEWVNQRNEERYDNTVSHGKNYDAKNMMHVFRLLNMAEEIARYKKVNVRRPDREWLLKIRAGEFMYEDLVKEAEEKIEIVNELFEKSDLPESPDASVTNRLLITIRESFYK